MKLIIFITLFFSSISANAQWTYYSESDDKKVTFYIDHSSIKRNGGISKMWTMQDYADVQKQGQRSIKYLLEFDCKNDSSRGAAFLAFSKQMGSGDVLYQDYKNDPWRPYTPDSVSASLAKIACVR